MKHENNKSNEFIKESEAIAIDLVVFCEDFVELNERGDLSRAIGEVANVFFDNNDKNGASHIHAVQLAIAGKSREISTNYKVDIIINTLDLIFKIARNIRERKPIALYNLAVIRNSPELAQIGDYELDRLENPQLYKK
jgi:hypothetical protein